MEVRSEVRAVYSEIQAIRHKLHRCPELGHREVETTRLIRACLEEYGAEVLDYGFPTGLAARIRGGHPGKLLALREDIDALPILENTGLPFASQTPGVCHACGHDVHAAALLGCAKLLARHREELWGDVLLIFQCGEETFDGAAAMLSQGLFRDGTPDAVVGFHCAPDLPLGTISIREGIANASCDSIRLEVTGKGGHGAHPELCVDPVVLSAGLLMQLQTLVSRNNNPADPVVLTFGEIHGGPAPSSRTAPLAVFRRMAPCFIPARKARSTIPRVCSVRGQWMDKTSDSRRRVSMSTKRRDSFSSEKSGFRRFARTFMPMARQMFTNSRPMLPYPRIPRVLPYSSIMGIAVTAGSAADFQPPCFIRRSNSPARLVTASKRARVCWATAREE